ncbi:uncharacterized protein LOC112201719 [Rosa chinensis]|uniref:uncharacterized protein LOC112201719 n=1 Tax=Rosa chinensis TaxID=74649 RepID=UPI000D09282F|nr:uncharacterized protein LOC112201719 [Rosa chinensis]XP_040375381.1 uncharacterized protein LOC112201719 [Rosa chinensis]
MTDPKEQRSLIDRSNLSIDQSNPNEHSIDQSNSVAEEHKTFFNQSENQAEEPLTVTPSPHLSLIDQDFPSSEDHLEGNNTKESRTQGAANRQWGCHLQLQPYYLWCRKTNRLWLFDWSQRFRPSRLDNDVVVFLGALYLLGLQSPSVRKGCARDWASH